MRGEVREDPRQHELHVCKSKTVETESIVENAEQPAQKEIETREAEEVSPTSHVPGDCPNSDQTRSSTEENDGDDDTPTPVFTTCKSSSSVEKEIKLTADSSREYESRSLLMSEMRKYVIKSRKATIYSRKDTMVQPEIKQPRKKVVLSYVSAMAAFDHKAVCAPRPVLKLSSDASEQNKSKNSKQMESEDTDLKRMTTLYSDRTLVTTNTTASIRNFASNTQKSADRVIARNQSQFPHGITPSRRLFYFNKLKAAKNDQQREDIMPNSKVSVPLSKEASESSFNNFHKKSSDEDRQSILKKLRNEKRRMELERTKKSVIKERTSLFNQVRAHSKSKSQFHEFIEPRTFYTMSKQDEETDDLEEMKKRNTARRKELLSLARSYKRLDDQQKKSANTEEDFSSRSERRENFLLDNFRTAQSFFTLEKANSLRTKVELNIEDEPMKVEVNETETKKNAFIDNFRAAHSFFTNEIMKADANKSQSERLESALEKETSRNRNDPIQRILTTMITEPELADAIPKHIFIEKHEEGKAVESNSFQQKRRGDKTQESILKSRHGEEATLQVIDVPNHILIYDEEDKANVQTKPQEYEHTAHHSAPKSSCKAVGTMAQVDTHPFFSPGSSGRKDIVATSDTLEERTQEEILDKSEYRRKEDDEKKIGRCDSLEQEREDEKKSKYLTQSLLSSSSDSSESSSLDENETSLHVLFHDSMKKLSALLGTSTSGDASYESFDSDDD